MLKTKDMYLASFLMTEGMFIHNMKTKIHPRLGPTVEFEINGFDEEAERQSLDDYHSEDAKTNIRRYLTSLNIIRNAVHCHMEDFKEDKKNKKQKNINGKNHEYGRKESKTSLD